MMSGKDQQDKVANYGWYGIIINMRSKPHNEEKVV